MSIVFKQLQSCPPRISSALLFVFLGLLTSSPPPCQAASPSESLLLQGYNYTDHYIDSFTVNGQGGGNIYESSPTSGGGGSVCCVSWQPGSKLPVKIRVRWTASYCTKFIQTKFGDYDQRQDIFKEQEAWISQAVDKEPRALEVHFYPDGHIEAAVTSGDSPPRLKLPRDGNRNRLGVSQEIPRCPDDKK